MSIYGEISTFLSILFCISFLALMVFHTSNSTHFFCWNCRVHRRFAVVPGLFGLNWNQSAASGVWGGQVPVLGFVLDLSHQIQDLLEHFSLCWRRSLFWLRDTRSRQIAKSAKEGKKKSAVAAAAAAHAEPQGRFWIISPRQSSDYTTDTEPHFLLLRFVSFIPQPKR